MVADVYSEECMRLRAVRQSGNAATAANPMPGLVLRHLAAESWLLRRGRVEWRA